jgi:hypothetical protein
MSVVEKSGCGAAVIAFLACLAVSGCTDRPGAPVPLAGSQECPPWVNFPIDPHSNDDSPYLGCVNRVNLENQVARPFDLNAGRPLGPPDGERETHSVKTY